MHLFEAMGVATGVENTALIETGLWVTKELGLTPDSMLAKAYQLRRNKEAIH